MSFERKMIDNAGLSPWPSEITLYRDSRTLEMMWGETRATVSHRALRAACKCAECESHRRDLYRSRAPAPHDAVEAPAMDVAQRTVMDDGAGLQPDGASLADAERPDVLPLDDVALLRIEPVGETGLRLFFSDGHARGIYPWSYLRSIALRK